MSNRTKPKKWSTMESRRFGATNKALMKLSEDPTLKNDRNALPDLLPGTLLSLCVIAIIAWQPGFAIDDNKSSVAVGIGGTKVTGEKTAAKDSGEMKPTFVTPAAPKLDPKESVGTIQLQGNAEVTELDQGAAQRASQDYRRGLAALNGNNYAHAAELFKRAGEQFGHGFEKYKAEANFAEAQCRQQIGQMDESSKLYHAAKALFEQFDPRNPFLKACVDQLGAAFKVQTPRLAPEQRKLFGTTHVDQNITLKGNVNDDGVRMSGEKAILDVDKKFIKDSVHQCFVEMTCLETAEIGSNSTNAKNRWVPLMAYGKTAAMTATDDFFSPVIRVAINGKPYNINVVLPGLSSNQRTVLLVTDGEKIAAIDPGTNDVWLLEMKLKANSNKGDFNWKKLLHQKSKIKRELKRP